MNWSIEFAPLLPPPILWAAAAVAVVLLVIMFARGTRGAALRALAVLAMFGALLNPLLKQEERNALSNIAVVVIDKSLSQTLTNRPEQTEKIKKALEARLGKIPNLEVRWVSAQAGSGKKGGGTKLFERLNSALSNIPPDRIAGVLMITDGQVHDVPSTKEALGFDAPVHALITGKPNEFDRHIEILKAPRYGIVGQTRQIQVRIKQSGKSKHDGQPVKLIIRREGAHDEIRTTIVGRTENIDIPIPHSGTNSLELELEAVEGELTLANNRAVVSTQGVRENLRVLLVSGEPHAGERTWRNLLKSDPAVDLVHFTILRPPEKQDGTPINELSLIAFPTRELFSIKIKDFDLIIFDRYQHRGILRPIYYDNISRYVSEHGGAILIAAGDDYAGKMSIYKTPLLPVLPAEPTGRVIEKPFTPDLTKDGYKHPVTRDLPGLNTQSDQKPSWGRWLRQVEVRGVRGSVLMKGIEDKPLLILERKGKGRAALLTSDHAWLWARGFEGGGPHTDLLRRLAHWLMKEPDLEEERLSASSTGLKVTIERRSMAGEINQVTLSGPGGEKQTIDLSEKGEGIWRATIDVKQPGLYRAQTESTVGTLTAIAHAGNEDPIEVSEVTATTQRLKPLIESTGGGAFWTSSTGLNRAIATSDTSIPRISMLKHARVMAGSGWLALKDRDAYLTRGVRLTPLFTGLAALAALLMLLSLAWWREGR